MTVYHMGLTVIEETLRTIETRARLYRGLVQLLVLAGALLVALAAFVSAWALLYAPAIAVLLVTGWVAMDSAELNRWRQGVARTGIAPGVLADALRGRADVPQNTVAEMLKILPANQRSGRRALLASLALALGLACGARAIQARWSVGWGAGAIGGLGMSLLIRKLDCR
ncbi:MAG TPA: hypothetical protein VLI55_12895 [Bryobacteraceae bacterium]|nr:hypothetical protein [Bryobacteraceae bacterium]